MRVGAPQRKGRAKNWARGRSARGGGARGRPATPPGVLDGTSTGPPVTAEWGRVGGPPAGLRAPRRQGTPRPKNQKRAAKTRPPPPTRSPPTLSPPGFPSSRGRPLARALPSPLHPSPHSPGQGLGVGAQAHGVKAPVAGQVGGRQVGRGDGAWGREREKKKERVERGRGRRRGERLRAATKEQLLYRPPRATPWPAPIPPTRPGTRRGGQRHGP